MTQFEFGEKAICPWCGKEFIRRSTNHEYCCNSCHERAKYAKQRGVTEFEFATCLNCGKEFKRIKGGSDYCSAKCRKESRSWLHVPEHIEIDISAEEEAWKTHVYLVHKWVYEGMTVPGIAKMTGFSEDNINKALAESITEHQQKMIEYYAIM